MNRANHHEHKDVLHSKRALWLAIWVCGATFLIELLGGLWTNSLSLLSDSAHVFMDLVSFSLSLSAISLAERSVSDTRTFGWHRLEVFAALINSLTVLGIAGFIFLHALKRIAHPEHILSAEMLVIALAGLFANLFVIWKLHSHSKEDVNVRSAFLHALGDAAASVAVVVGGTAVLLTGKTIVDPVVAILVAGIIVLYAGGTLRESIHILLEGVPGSIDRGAVARAIEEISGPGSVSDLHIWNVCSHICALSVHLVLPAEAMPRQKEILDRAHLHLEEKFNIVHTTIQIESKEWHSN